MKLLGLECNIPRAVVYTLILFSSSLALADARPSLVVTYNRSGRSTSTSNPYEDYIKKGVDLAADNIIFVDHGESTAQTLYALEKINELNPKVVVGMGTSAQALLSAKKLKSDILLITPVATSTELLKDDKNVFLLSNANSVQADILAAEIKSTYRKGDRLLIVDLAGCPYCGDLAQAMSERFKKFGIEFEMTKPHQSQIDESKNELIAFKDFDIILVSALEAEAAKIISILYPRNKAAVFYGGDGWGTLARFIRELPFASQVRAKWVSHYHEGISNPLNKAFVDRYTKKYGSRPIDTAAFYYEATILGFYLAREDNFKKMVDKLHAMSTINTLTGPAVVRRWHLVRPMPLLSLIDGEVRMERLIDWKSRNASH